MALLPAIGKDRLGVDEVAIGVLRAAGGVGAVLTAMVLAVRPVRIRVGRVLLVAVAVFGLGTILLGSTSSYFVAFLAMMILSAADMISVFIRGTIVPMATPDNMRGRVLAVEQLFIGGSNELGAFESGVAGQALGASPAIVLGGVATWASSPCGGSRSQRCETSTASPNWSSDRSGVGNPRSVRRSAERMGARVVASGLVAWESNGVLICGAVCVQIGLVPMRRASL